MDNALTQEASTMSLDRSPAGMAGDAELLDAIRRYWNTHIHDLEIAKHPVGTKEFFEDLREYRFDKLRYLPEVADFAAYQGKRLLEVGCGVGLDLREFAQQGSQVTGVDLAESAIQLATQNFTHHEVHGDLRVMNGERLEFEDDSFDAVYAHGVLQYTADPRRMLAEIHRVLRPGGDALLMVYNRYSWLNLLSVLGGVTLEHEDAPVLNKYSVRQFADMLGNFSAVHISFERFPVKTRLHGGLKGMLFNTLFVPLFSVLPTPMIRRSGWHLLAKVKK